MEGRLDHRQQNESGGMEGCSGRMGETGRDGDGEGLYCTLRGGDRGW